MPPPAISPISLDQSGFLKACSIKSRAAWSSNAPHINEAINRVGATTNLIRRSSSMAVSKAPPKQCEASLGHRITSSSCQIAERSRGSRSPKQFQFVDETADDAEAF